MSVQRTMFGKNTYTLSKLGPQLYLVLIICITKYFIELNYTVTFVKMCFCYVFYKIKQSKSHFILVFDDI